MALTHNATPGAAFGVRDNAADRWEAKKSRALERRGRLGKATSNAILGNVGALLGGDESAGSAPPKLERRRAQGVDHPPGGKTSFSFGEGEGERPAARAVSLEPACWQDQPLEPARRSGSRPPSGKPPGRLPGRPPTGRPPTGAATPTGAPTPRAPNSYAEELAQQVEEKRARKVVERATDVATDVATERDDRRADREAGELRRGVGREMNKQRRERATSENGDALTRFLAENAGPPKKALPSQAEIEERALDARRQAVPGLCPPPSGGTKVAGSRSLSEGPRGRAHGAPQKSSASLDFGEPVKRTSANMYANGASQNCGNGITEVPTSRVLKPPGGGGSLQLGWG